MSTLKLGVIVALTFLCGCSNTTVHLHAKNLTETEQESIRIGLEAQGFSVKKQNNDPPTNNNLVLYYPHEGIGEDLL